MSDPFLPFTVVLNPGELGPAWTLDVALQVAREAEQAGRQVSRIIRGREIILEGEDLRRAMVSET
jgi:hypothetical protein